MFDLKERDHRRDGDREPYKQPLKLVAEGAVAGPFFRAKYRYGLKMTPKPPPAKANLSVIIS